MLKKTLSKDLSLVLGLPVRDLAYVELVASGMSTVSKIRHRGDPKKLHFRVRGYSSRSSDGATSISRSLSRYIPCNTYEILLLVS